MVRYRSLLLALVFAASPALAGPREDVYSASLRCSAIADDRAWLDCYYGAAQPMRGQLKLPAAPAAQTALIPPVIDADGLRQQQARAVPEKEGVIGQTLGYLAGGAAVISNVAVTSSEPGQPTGFTVTLANGQVWRQTDEQVRLVRWRGGPGAHRVTVWKGALNTLNLGFDDEADRYKVRRLK
jgi:hypothetical protein